MSDEGKKRDRGIARAAANPENHFEPICEVTRNWLDNDVSPGRLVVAGEAYREVMARAPHLKPREKRVMGGVMRRMGKEGRLLKAGLTTRDRSHKGFAREWERTGI